MICDKPLTSTLTDARKLKDIAEKSDALFVLTHNYTGYPLVRQAREMVAEGLLGEIRLVQMEYPQDWLTEAIEQDGQKQAAWRTDPSKSGAGGSTAISAPMPIISGPSCPVWSWKSSPPISTASCRDGRSTTMRM